MAVDCLDKTELVAGIAEESGVTKSDCETVVDALVKQVEKALKDGDKAQLVGFGSFEVKNRAARMGRNPKTKAAIEIPASKAPVFKAGKGLKDAIQ